MSGLSGFADFDCSICSGTGADSSGISCSCIVWKPINQKRENPDYRLLGSKIGRLVHDKQGRYGDSFNNSGQIMRILYPEGIKHWQMDDALAVVRIIDKLFRIANSKEIKEVQPVENPAADIAGYALLLLGRDS